MRTLLLALIVMSSLAACGKKQAPQAPASATDSQSGEDENENEEQNINTPEKDVDAADSADPCEGGE